MFRFGSTALRAIQRKHRQPHSAEHLLTPQIHQGALAPHGSNSNLTASVIRNSRRLPDRRIAARASRQGLGERDDEAPSNCCDRVGDVPFGSDRRRLWVGNRREWQIPRAARRNVVQRGGWRLVRRSKSRRRQYREWHGGGSRATRALHNHQARVPASAPDNRARSAIATLRHQPNVRRRYPLAKWQTNTWSARLLLAA